MFALFANSSSICSYALNLNAETTFYTNQPFYCDYATTIKNGGAYHISCDAKNLQKILKKIDKKHVKGESFCIFGSKNDLNNIVRRLNVVVKNEEQIDDAFIVEGYNSKFGNSIFVNGKEINIQLAYHNGLITVGCPVILGSF